MSITILDKLSASGQMAAMMGKGVGSGLKSLIDNKLSQIQKQAGLTSLVGPDAAKSLSFMPDSALKDLIPQYLKQQQTKQDLSTFDQQNQLSQSSDGKLNQLIDQSGVDQFSQQDSPGNSDLAPQPTEEQLLEQHIIDLGRSIISGGGSLADAKKAQGTERDRINKNIDKEKDRAFKEKQAEAAITAQKKKDIRTDQRESDKETLPFFKEVMNDAKGARENQRRLDRMDELVRKGTLDSPTFSSVLDTASKGIFGFGINLDALRSPDSQEFQKLSTEFVKDAKSLFGPKVTQQEIQLFMKMVPTLNQSDKGKLRVINNMNAYNKAKNLKKDAMEKIIKDNGGRRPLGLESLVEAAIEPELDKLSQAFKQGYNIEAEPEKERSSLIGRSQDFLGDLPFKLSDLAFGDLSSKK